MNLFHFLSINISPTEEEYRLALEVSAIIEAVKMSIYFFQMIHKIKYMRVIEYDKNE